MRVLGWLGPYWEVEATPCAAVASRWLRNEWNEGMGSLGPLESAGERALRVLASREWEMDRIGCCDC